MARLHPDMDQILRGRQPPTEGELYLLQYLQVRFDPEADVFFQPCFNGDRPDIVLIKKDIGVIIIEVKDWDLAHYRVDEKNQWSVKNGSQPLRGPFAQAFHYKDTFFNIHGNGLLEKRLKNENFYNIINVFVYFHKAGKKGLTEFYRVAMEQVKRRIEENNTAYSGGAKPRVAYDKAWAYFDKKLKAMERDAFSLSVTSENLAKIAFRSRGRNSLFEDGVYDEFMRLLQPPFHYANQGRLLDYTKKQAQLVESTAGRKIKIRGLAGSGKTTVLAKRAVNAHRRHGGEVLILTFNLTLGRYIKDKLNEVRDDFSWSNFHVSNYHRFITSALGNAGVKVEFPPDHVQADTYLEENFYSNVALFLAMKSAHGSGYAVFDAKALFRYETILIDEVQDYKPAWLKIIMEFFLAEGGELVLFGDEKQNIYHRSMDSEKKPRLPNGFGKWEQLRKSFRFKQDSHILTLASAFQRTFVDQHYEADHDESFQPSLTNLGINLCYSYQDGAYEAMARLIIGIAKEHSLHPNDISVIGAHKKELQEIDFLIRKGTVHRERTITTFESIEVTKHVKLSEHARKVGASKKYGFNLNSGVMKLSTIHSFKGYESPTIFLFVGPKDSVEMVYTGLTRARENIVVIIHEGSEYREFFATHLAPAENTFSDGLPAHDVT